MMANVNTLNITISITPVGIPATDVTSVVVVGCSGIYSWIVSYDVSVSFFVCSESLSVSDLIP